MNLNQPKVKLFIVLLIVLGLTVLIGYRINRGQNPVVVQAQGQKAAAATPALNDARIRLDMLDKDAAIGDDLGKSNIFQYRVTKAPEPPPKPAGPPVVQPPEVFTPAAPARIVPPPPPPPPPIPLKYIGFGHVEPNSKALIATLIEDNYHFNAIEGTIWRGRYRVVKITETSVEVEDMEFSRHQTLPLIKQ